MILPRFILLLGFFLVMASSCGQESRPHLTTVQVSGTVVIEGSLSPLMGVACTDLRSGNVSVTDPSGRFTLFVATASFVQLLIEHDGLEQVLDVGAPPTDGSLINLVYSPTERLFSLLEEPIQEPPTPNLTPVGPSTPAPQPSPESPTLFDGEGNTSSFGIPSGLRGNIDRGRRIMSSQCLQCHGERGSGLSYNRLKSVLGAPPMNLNLSPQTVADLTAYVNRRRRS